MKLSGDRFSVPKCIFLDNLPGAAFRTLVFLFSVSDIAGRSAPGYDAIKKGARITSRNTVAASLKTLRKHGWFHFVNKSPGRNAAFLLRIPPRFSETDRSLETKKITRFRSVP